MANQEHLTIIKQGVNAWNKWRENNPRIQPDFSGADIRGINFKGMNLAGADFNNAKAGLRGGSKAALLSLSLFFSVISGFFSLSGSSWVFLAIKSFFEDVAKCHIGSAQLALLFLIFSILLLMIMVIAIRYCKFWALAGAVALAGAGAGAVACILILSYYISWRVLKGDEQFISLRKIVLFFTSLGGTDFRNADLTEANFSGAVLKGSRFNNGTIINRTCWRNAKKIELARLTSTILENRNVRELLVTGMVKDRKELFNRKELFIGINLKGANLANVDLSGIDFTEADLSNATLENASVRNANLIKTQALGVEFRGADLTGACLEAWNIDSTTQLEGAHADYVYLLRNKEERRPNSGIFGEGEFSKLFQEVLNTVDLIFKNGIDWKAFMISFDNLREKIRVESEGADITVQSIENKGDGVFVVRVNVPFEIDKAEVHSEFKQEYSNQLKLIEEKYQASLLQGKENEIAIYRKQNINLMEIIRQQSQKPIQIYAGGTMGDTISIVAQGDIAFSKDQAMALINKQINQTSGIQEDLAKKLRELSAAVEKMIKNMPDDKARDVTDDLEKLVNEVSKEQPKKKWYQISADGLIEAAKTVGAIGTPVITITQSILKLLGG